MTTDTTKGIVVGTVATVLGGLILLLVAHLFFSQSGANPRWSRILLVHTSDSIDDRGKLYAVIYVRNDGDQAAKNVSFVIESNVNAVEISPSIPISLSQEDRRSEIHLAAIGPDEEFKIFLITDHFGLSGARMTYDGGLVKEVNSDVLFTDSYDFAMTFWQIVLSSFIGSMIFLWISLGVLSAFVTSKPPKHAPDDSVCPAIVASVG